MEVLDAEEPQEEFANIEQETQEEQVPVEQEPTEEETLPEKYRGKSTKDLAKMLQDSEAMIGRQAQEVGEVRRLADELLKSQLKKQPEVEQSREVDFFENPQEAIRQAVANSPDVLQAKQATLQMQQEYAQRKLVEKHPDFANIVQDNSFAEWVKNSPIRQQLYQMANNYDVNAADELISTYKQLKNVKQTKESLQISEEEKQTRSKRLKAASVDTGGSGETSRKIYRRADLIRLRMNDPARYEALSDEIQRAYSEDRVK